MIVLAQEKKKSRLPRRGCRAVERQDSKADKPLQQKCDELRKTRRELHASHLVDRGRAGKQPRLAVEHGLPGYFLPQRRATMMRRARCPLSDT